tara:strand:- start:2547 stop:3284 length:738 start_codon:yes stop_codon:yes gene_type:complete
MKYKILVLIFLLTSCTTYSTKLENRKPFNSKGFAYIFNEKDYENKIIKSKLDNTELQIAHNSLYPNTLIKIINPKTNQSIIIKNFKKTYYPDFYKILITNEVAKKLNLDPKIPFVEVLEIRKNKSFIAKKAKIYSEEKKISSNAPIETVQISNISKIKKKHKNIQKNDFYILIASFYSKDVADFLKQRITKEIPEFNSTRLKISKKNIKEINLISGPYNTINLMKNDYILLKKFGFEELNIITDE